MDLEGRVSVRHSLISLALLAQATAAALSCGDSSPVGVDLQTDAPLPAWSNTPRRTGLVPCSQSYDSVTQVIGPAGGAVAVGPHVLYVEALALSNAVRITAVAPADTVRWVRFQPDGLVFQTNPARYRSGEGSAWPDHADADHEDGGADVDHEDDRSGQPRERFGDVSGWGAILYTSYKGCGVPLSDTLRIAQVNDSLRILGYLTTYVKSKEIPWSQANQYVAALLPHFSNYAVAW